MKRIAVVGLGKMGLLHASILNSMPDVELACVCEANSLIRLFGKRALSNVSIVKKLSELKGAQFDAVYVTTPASTHYPIVLKIYNESIAQNIFVEKPFTFVYQQSLELCELAERNKGTAMVGYMKRFAPTFKMAKSFVDEGRLGPITSFAGHAYSSDFCSPADFIPQAFSRGDVLRDIGCHALDMMQWMLGNMSVMSAELTVKNKAKSSYVDSARVKMIGPGGVSGTFDTSWSQANYRLPEIGMSVTGSQGKIKVTDEVFEFYRDGDEPIIKKRAELEEGVPFFLAESDYYHEDRCFIDALYNGDAARIDFSSACKTDLIIDKILNTVHNG